MSVLGKNPSDQSFGVSVAAGAGSGMIGGAPLLNSYISQLASDWLSAAEPTLKPRPLSLSPLQASLGNPLYLVKARMQAYSPFLPVGAQHQYKSGFDALRTIYRAEGVRGMFRGIDAAILRTGMGSSVRPPLQHRR
jgi:hypothetical protein